jgi:hypothetical protein
MADNLQLTVTGSDGTVYTISGAVTNATVVKTSPVVVPPPPVGPIAPTIPATAKVIDCLPLTWSAAQDPATNPGKASATGTSTYPVSFNGSTGLRQFNFTLGNRGGILFHCNPLANASAIRNVVLEFDAESPDWSNVACQETDLNWVDNSGTGVNAGKGAVTIIGQQLAGWDNCAEITTVSGGACHWNKTSVSPIDPRTWAKGSRHKVRWFASHNGAGIVTYEGVEIDGVWHPFTSGNVLSSLDPLWWEANLLNAQLQFDGSSTGTVASIVYAHVYTVSCW